MAIATGTGLAIAGGATLLGGLIGGRGGGTTKQVSQTILTDEQKELIEKQTKLAEFQLQELKRQRKLQAEAFDPAAAAAQSYEDFTTGLTGSATPEQRALIDEAIQSALAAGESDIKRFQTESTEQLREELAPQLGLYPGDTPILDRGSRIASEAARQQGQLVSKLNLQRATSLLEYPAAIQDFQSRLRQQAFVNRLQLAGGKTSAGLGLVGISPNVGAVLSTAGSASKSSNPVLGLSSTLGGIGGLLSGIGAITGS